MKYIVTFMRHGNRDSLTFDCRADAEAFANWGQYDTTAFIDSDIEEVEDWYAQAFNGPPINLNDQSG